MSGRPVSEQLALAERIVDTSGVAPMIEQLLPLGVRRRQLRTRTLLVAIILTMLDGRDALLTQVRRTLLALSEADRQRLGVTVQWRAAAHTLSYRQIEYTYRLICTRLSKKDPGGVPSSELRTVLDALLEASVRVLGVPDSSSYAVDWTAHETWSRPPPGAKEPAETRTTPPGANSKQRPPDAQPAAAGTHPPPTTDARQPPAPEQAAGQPPARERRTDREAAWGHRTVTHPSHTELFFGYYLQAITTIRDEHGPEVPELARRIHLASPRHDPPAQIVPVIRDMINTGIPLNDLLADSGYSYRQAHTFALPLRALNVQLTMDLHPNDRGPHGTHNGATCSNGNLYCPATPPSLLDLSPLPRGASVEQTETHDQNCSQLAAYKLSPISGYDNDGYRRVICPAAAGRIRCPLRPASMTLSYSHPTISQPPEHPPVCCTQKTITVPPHVNAKTAQKHDYPSPQHRHAYARRTAAERTFATTTDRSTNDLSRGWCRLFGLTPIAILVACVYIARNIRINDAFTARQAEQHRRATLGLPPKRRRRRDTLNEPAAANPAPQPTTLAA